MSQEGHGSLKRIIAGHEHINLERAFFFSFKRTGLLYYLVKVQKAIGGYSCDIATN